MSTNNPPHGGNAVAIPSEPPRTENALYTLLPRPIASAISLGARTASLSLRFGSFFSHLAISGARTTTLTSLELTRAVLETILSRAGQDVAVNSTSTMGRDEAENLLERCLATLHSTITKASFLASAGFQFSTIAVSTSSSFTQNVLSMLDQVFGDTESSRAIAAIVTLTRREFSGVETTLPGETLSFSDLFVGATAFAILQRWSTAQTIQELASKGTFEQVWDIVVLDNGKRADVITARPRSRKGSNELERRRSIRRRRRPTSFISTTGQQEILEAFPRDESDSLGLTTSDAFSWPDEGFGKMVLGQLPSTTHVSVRSAISRVVTVEISGQLAQELHPPPGYFILSEEHHPGPGLPFHRFVFQAVREEHGSAETLVFPESSRRLSLIDKPPVTSQNSPTDSNVVEYQEDSRPISREEFPDSGYDSEKIPSQIPVPAAGKKGILTSTKKAGVTSLGRPQTPENEAAKANSKRQRTMISSPSRSSIKPGTVRSSATQWPDGLPYTAADARKDSSKPEKRSALKQSMSKVSAKPNLGGLLGRDARRPPAQSGPGKDKATPRLTKAKPSSLQKLDVNARPQNLTSSVRAGQSHIHSRSSNSPITTSFILDLDNAKDFEQDERTLYTPGPGSRPQTPYSLDVGVDHSRRGSIVSGYFTLHANASDTSVALSRAPGTETPSRRLQRQSNWPGQWPPNPFVKNLNRFCRFSSAAYGSHFLRLMGLVSSENQPSFPSEHFSHAEHQSFSQYTRLPSSSILLSSFVDPHGGFDASGHTDSGVPLTHFVALDHNTKSVVLACRGTLGFEDVLADMACDYDTLVLNGHRHTVHRGILASARRLLYGRAGRVMTVVKAALEEFDDYGLVLCGHSLGGGVAALLATLISERNPSKDPNAPAFITLGSSSSNTQLLLPSTEPKPTSPGTPPVTAAIDLPAGRPIHAFAYGPPASVDASLAAVNRGLVTTLINNADLIPFLSLGTLRDCQALALAFKSDASGAKAEIRGRLWASLSGALKGDWAATYMGDPNELDLGAEQDEDSWPWAALKSLRANMIHDKLVPPGDVFVVETSSVLQRDAFTRPTPSPEAAEEAAHLSTANLGRPATRVQLKYIHDSPTWFREIRFAGSMFADHSPRRYETALKQLETGVAPD